MAYKLPTDCLNEIFEYLEFDKFTLHSCLLVNHHWCEISVSILWRNTLNIKFGYRNSFKTKSSILSTLIACLPNESKKLLHDNEIFISTPTSKPLLFNYASFCKILSIYQINKMINSVLKNSLLDSKDGNSLVVNEIIKMFASQITSLKKLTYTFYHNNRNISFPHFPGARDLSELCVSSDLSSDFFYQLSQICHNLQSISIKFYDSITNELNELISSQNNLKNLYLSASDGSWADIIPTITKHSHTITKLKLYIDVSGSDKALRSSIAKFCPNLKSLFIIFRNDSDASPDYLESFFISWERRTPKKLLSFIIIVDAEFDFTYSCEILEIIEKYDDLGIIKFITKSEEEEIEEEEESYDFK
ncbi:hypothetical protein GLOIN_2v1784405 [Rhizophagus irregularis DAOM 181602=DAOM 197198]|nr:hypothetical protein GLOIN_2v1784405 [Rhizophagus irregularis DAOM 181602=DAOM 197198]